MKGWDIKQKGELNFYSRHISRAWGITAGLDTDAVLNGTFIFPDNTKYATRNFILACKPNPNVTHMLESKSSVNIPGQRKY